MNSKDNLRLIKACLASIINFSNGFLRLYCTVQNKLYDIEFISWYLLMKIDIEKDSTISLYIHYFHSQELWLRLKSFLSCMHEQFLHFRLAYSVFWHRPWIKDELHRDPQCGNKAISLQGLSKYIQEGDGAGICYIVMGIGFPDIQKDNHKFNRCKSVNTTKCWFFEQDVWSIML